MKIALIKPPSTYADWYRRPVLGLAYLCAYLGKNGYECKIFDAYFLSLSFHELLRRVADYKPDVIGISAMTHEIVEASRIAGKLKEQLKVPVIVGGCHVTALPQKTLEEFDCFDYGIYGEGEYTTLELIQYLKDGNPQIPSIKGIIWRNQDRNTHVNEPRPFLTSEELDSLPYPAFHLYYGSNRNALSAKGAYYVMFTSRGCPYHCIFCMQVLGRRVRRRSIQNVLDEMEHAISTYGAHTFDFADEIFLFDSPYTRSLLQQMIEMGLPKKIRWSGLTRANFVNEEIIALAKKAGCCHLYMGIESGDNEILKSIGKRITVEQARDACRIIKQAGIRLGTYYILGHPNETVQTVRKTVNLAIELNTDTIAVGIMVPYPGTKVYDMALRGEAGYRLISADWSMYDKYGGRSLELRNLPYKDLLKCQKRTLINFYLKNLRLLGLIVYFWKRRQAVIYFLKKLITELVE